MKLRKLQKRLLVMSLCTAIVVGVFPAVARAETETAGDSLVAADVVQSEVVEYREENVKHFNMGGGIYQAIAYSHPVHKKDSEGNWQDIDFSLKRSARNGVQIYSSEVSDASFAARYVENQPLMTLTGTNTPLSITVNKPTLDTVAQKNTLAVGAARVTSAEQKLETFEAAQAACFESTILYENVLPNADLKYVSDGSTISEQIIVSQKILYILLQLPAGYDWTVCAVE